MSPGAGKHPVVEHHAAGALGDQARVRALARGQQPQEARCDTHGSDSKACGPRPDSPNSPTPRPQALTSGPFCPQPLTPNPPLPLSDLGIKSQIFIQGIFNSFVTDRRLLFYSDASAKVTRRTPLRAPAGAAAEPRGARWVRWAQPTRAPVASTPQQRWRPGPSSLGPEAADRVAESARAHDNPGPSPARHAALLGWRPPSGLPSPPPRSRDPAATRVSEAPAKRGTHLPVGFATEAPAGSRTPAAAADPTLPRSLGFSGRRPPLPDTSDACRGPAAPLSAST